MAYYYPINGKIELKKHRASTNSEINKFIKERTYDGINFILREPSTNELKRLDTIRSEYDPMEYEGEDEEEEEEEEEEEQQEEQQQQEVETKERIDDDDDDDVNSVIFLVYNYVYFYITLYNM